VGYLVDARRDSFDISRVRAMGRRFVRVAMSRCGPKACQPRARVSTPCASAKVGRGEGPASASARMAHRQNAASFSFFSARVLILTVAGLAAKTRSTFVNGSKPVRFFFAGTLITLTFNRPGNVNEPRPFL
jgi:hypothetical protein